MTQKIAIRPAHDRFLSYPVCLSVCLSETLVNSGQMLGWIKIPLGTNVGFRTGHIVLDGDPAPLKGAQ